MSMCWILTPGCARKTQFDGGTPSRLGFGDAFRGSCRGPLQMQPPVSGFRSRCIASGVVGVEVESSMLGHAAENPDVRVGHDRRDPGSGIGIETAAAWGSECGASSSRNRRKPTAPSNPSRVCSGSPHAGQAGRYAAAAGVKRSRQSGHEAWVISGPFWWRRSRRWRGSPTRSFPAARVRRMSTCRS